MLTEIVEQGRERRELVADAGGSDRALLEVLVPADDVSARDATQFRNAAQPGEGDELLDFDLLGAAGFGIRR
jgi:hypothetical protein